MKEKPIWREIMEVFGFASVGVVFALIVLLLFATVAVLIASGAVVAFAYVLDFVIDLFK